MPDSVLLRFRDLTPGIETVKEHNAIVATRGRVLWGWWKKPYESMPDPGLSNLQRDLTPGQKRVLFIDSGTGKLFMAPLFNIHYRPGGPTTPPPTPELCPEYYRRQDLSAWFEVGSIEEITDPRDGLDAFVFSTSNRVVAHHTISSLHQEAIGQTVSGIRFLDSNVSLWFLTRNEDIGLLGRGDIVRPLDRGVWPAKGHCALHLSDLHFGVAHAFRNELGDREIGTETMFEALIQDLESLGIDDTEISLLLVTGDLTWTGDPHEFANAERFLERLAGQLGLHRSQVIVIPGNHDIEWREGKGDVDLNAELNFRNFSLAFYRSEPTKSLLRIASFRIESRPITVIALNSCRVETKENAGLGFVGREQLMEMVRFLRGDARVLPHDPEELRIALLHHHLLPVNYVEGIDWETKRVSITLDADAVIRTLMSAAVKIVLHGHQHQPYAAELRRMLEGNVDPFGSGNEKLDRKIAVLGGGSIGVQRSHLNVVGRNAYNIIDFQQEHRLSVRTRVQSPVGPGFCDHQQVEFEV